MSKIDYFVFDEKTQTLDVAGFGTFEDVVMLIINPSHPPIMVFNSGRKEYVPFPEGPAQ